MKKNTSLVILSVLLIGLVFYFSYERIIALFIPAESPALISVHKGNKEFAKGYAAFEAGSFTEATGFFQKSLGAVQDSNEEAYIKRFLGASKVLAGDYKAGIADIKSVADNETSADTHRSYAIGLLGELYYRTGKDPEMTKLIFNSPPYASFLTDGDEERAYSRLYEYASSFYPTGTVGYRLAISHFYEGASTTDKQLKDAAQSLAEEFDILSVAKVDKAVLAEKLLDQANLRALYVIRAGADGESVEALFLQASALAVEGRGQFLKIRYYHALFLSQRYGTDRATDIGSLLAPFYDPAYKDNYYYKSFSDKKLQENPKIARNLAHIAAVDTRFRALMQSFGWKL